MVNKANFLLIALLVFAIGIIIASEIPSGQLLSGAASGNVSLEVLPAPEEAAAGEAPGLQGGGFEGKLTGTPTKKEITLSISVLNSGKQAIAGSTVDVSLSVLGASGEIELTYGISKDDDIITSDEETITVKSDIRIVRKIKIPKYLADGAYTAFTSAVIAGQSYDATDKFTITSVPAAPTAQFALAAPSPLLAAILMVGFALGAFVVLAHSHIKRDRAISNYLKKYCEYYFKKPEK